MKSYYYEVYGLTIKSEIEIPEFITWTKNKNKDADIIIQYGEVFNEIYNNISKGKNYFFSSKYIWFNINNIAVYHISNGNNITVCPYENVDVTMLNLYIQGSALGFIMLQRNYISIHGSAIDIDDKAVIFTGNKGAGKSSITSELNSRGYSLIADDVVGVTFEGVPYANPGFPYQKICADRIESLNINKEDYFNFEAENDVKYNVPVKGSFCKDKKALKVIFELVVDNVNCVSIEKLKGREKLFRVINNIYRSEFIPYIGGMNDVLMDKCVNVAKEIEYYRLVRPESKNTVSEQINLVEQVLFYSK